MRPRGALHSVTSDSATIADKSYGHRRPRLRWHQEAPDANAKQNEGEHLEGNQIPVNAEGEHPDHIGDNGEEDEVTLGVRAENRAPGAPPQTYRDTLGQQQKEDGLQDGKGKLAKGEGPDPLPMQRPDEGVQERLQGSVG